MTKVEKLEIEIRKLEESELTKFREWFYEYDSVNWDKQIGEDILSGRLDKLANDAIAQHTDGRSTKL